MAVCRARGAIVRQRPKKRQRRVWKKGGVRRRKWTNQKIQVGKKECGRRKKTFKEGNYMIALLGGARSGAKGRTKGSKKDLREVLEKGTVECGEGLCPLKGKKTTRSKKR